VEPGLPGHARPGKDSQEVNIEAKQPSVKGPAQTFSGDVWFDVVVPDAEYRANMEA